MTECRRSGAWLVGIGILLGLLGLGYQLGHAILDARALERSVTVKGLSEREFDADVVIWPIQFTAAGNDLTALYGNLDTSTARIRAFLTGNGFCDDEVTVSAPVITDKLAQQYGNNAQVEFRYTASQTVTVYSNRIGVARSLMTRLSELGKQGIVLSGGDYQSQPEYLFTRLNEVKPEMIEEATRQAREVAQKFAADSQSTLGRIRHASQGQFSIADRDRNNPHIKKVRVVSTVEYYLSD
jgi:uncharacterized protein